MRTSICPRREKGGLCICQEKWRKMVIGNQFNATKVRILGNGCRREGLTKMRGFSLMKQVQSQEGITGLFF